GYKVGLYTSPHLSDFRERIRILSPTTYNLPPTTSFEGMITEKELANLVSGLKPAIEDYIKESKYGTLSFFEVYTALAFVYFKVQAVDFAVLETGLGGRLDATNVVTPLVCAITPISYEHTQKLGNTLSEIAKEKSGIIKTQSAKRTTQDAIVISAPQEKEAREVIHRRCEEMAVKLYEVGEDITYQKTKDGFDIKGVLGEYAGLKINLLGEHQLVNASVAVGVIEALRQYGIQVGIASIKNGLYNTLWPGRCEVVSKAPLVILDGAQNIASAMVLRETIRDNFQYRKLILILGVSNDKDIKGICNELGGLADEIILTQADNPRAASPETLAKHFDGKKTYITNSVKEAKAKVKRIADKKDLVLVTGSLFVVGEFRKISR
ncbi:MAG: folylpolyglutamate synthase/dihydrofolate synthase family protein, partial [Candidatus Omnitrophota bacterium]